MGTLEKTGFLNSVIAVDEYDAAIETT